MWLQKHGFLSANSLVTGRTLPSLAPPLGTASRHQVQTQEKKASLSSQPPEARPQRMAHWQGTLGVGERPSGSPSLYHQVNVLTAGPRQASA